MGKSIGFVANAKNVVAKGKRQLYTRKKCYWLKKYAHSLKGGRRGINYAGVASSISTQAGNTASLQKLQTTSSIQTFFKMNKISIVILALISSFLFSCGTEDTAAALIDDEMAEMVEADIQSIETSVSSSSDIAETQTPSSLCGMSNDSSITVTGQNGNFTMTADWGWEVICAGIVPSQLDMEMGGTSSFTGNSVTSNLQVDANFVLSNVVSSDPYAIDGTIVLAGDVTTATRRGTRSVTSEADYVCTNLELDRDSHEILSGTMTVTLSGSNTAGNSFNRTATLVFNGSNTATLTLDNGMVYNLTW